MLDVPRGVRAIAAYLFDGDDGVSAQRRVRHLARNHNLPIRRIGGRIESRRSWLDRIYSEPDGPRAAPPVVAAKDVPAVPLGMVHRSNCARCHKPIYTPHRRGRPPMFHPECRS